MNSLIDYKQFGGNYSIGFPLLAFVGFIGLFISIGFLINDYKVWYWWLILLVCIICIVSAILSNIYYANNKDEINE
jgi:hypothetical protein